MLLLLVARLGRLLCTSLFSAAHMSGIGRFLTAGDAEAVGTAAGVTEVLAGGPIAVCFARRHEAGARMRESDYGRGLRMERSATP